MAFLLFIGALLVTYLLTRTTNGWFKRVMSEKHAALLTFAIWGGIALFALAGRFVPAKMGITYAIVPLMVWLLLDLARADKQICPRCGRRCRKELIACPRCGAGLGTGARVE